MSTRVINIKLREPFDVYIGRPMPGHKALGWGNPFKAGYNAHSGVDAINSYRVYLLDHPKLLARLPELRDKTLGCWCAPAGGLDGNIAGYVCHGQILAALADDPAPQQTLAQFVRALKNRDAHSLDKGAPVAVMGHDQAPGTCPICGARMERERQVGRCVYAEPCGHRLYQGRTREALQREWERRERIQQSIRRCGTELARHVHVWQPWGSDARYEHCHSCGASRKATTTRTTRTTPEVTEVSA